MSTRNPRTNEFQAKAVLAALLTLALSACGGSSGGGSDSGNGGNQNTPPPSPAVELSRTSLDFGKVVVGQTAQRTVTVTNTGNVKLSVTAANVGFAFSTDGACDSVSPGDTCNVAVSFKPTEQKSYTETVSFDSAADVPDVALSGTGEGLNVAINSLSCTGNTVNGRVIVSDMNGDPVTYLEQRHFTLTLQGADVPQSAFTFDGINESEPVSVGLALDWSESVVDVRTQIAQSTSIFLDYLRATDTAGVFRFARQIDGNKQPFVQTDADGIAILKDALDRPFDGADRPTKIWDAVGQVLNWTLQEPNKKAIVLVSDGMDTGPSTTPVEDVITAAQQENVALFTVAFGNDVDADVLTKLARETGGVYYSAPTNTELGEIYPSIASVVTNQYQITFTNPSPDTTSELTVSVQDDQNNQGDDTREVPVCQ